MRAAAPILATVLGFLSALAPSAAADEVPVILQQATLDEYMSYLRVLTGVDPIPGDPPYYLKNRYSLSTDIRKAANWLEAQFESFGLAAEQQTFQSNYGPNVVAELPGRTNPLDIYIIGGHYDTYHQANQLQAPGCDDNASGTATALIAGRILARYRFDATLRFIAFAGEEQWMVGSLAYAAAARAAGENIVGVINLDMILHPGFDNMNPDPDHDLDIESNAASAWLAQIVATEFGLYTPIDVQIHIGDDLYSDHWAFWQHGYHAVGLSENTVFEIWGGSNNAYHQLTDTIYNSTYEWDFALHSVRGAIASLVSIAGLIDVVVGDLNCDGRVDFGDINPFVLRLTSPAGYRLAFPGCPDAHGDINRDGLVDFGDINPFVRLLTSP
ncbi:MAG: M28 family peptidase [Planctomycetota bacterium]